MAEDANHGGRGKELRPKVGVLDELCSRVGMGSDGLSISSPHVIVFIPFPNLQPTSNPTPHTRVRPRLHKPREEIRAFDDQLVQQQVLGVGEQAEEEGGAHATLAAVA